MTESEVAALFYMELLKVAGGAAVVLGGLSAFLGKIWVNRIANDEAQVRDAKLAEIRAQFSRENSEMKARLDAALQRTVLVDKVRFEHEYTIYKEAWMSLHSLRAATLGLRPVLDYSDPSQSEDEQRKLRVGTLVPLYNTFRDAIETNKPFYPENVYRAFVDVLSKCHSEVIDYEYTERNVKEYWVEAQANRQAILAAIEIACEAIRARLAEVRVA